MRPLVIYHAHCMDGFTSAWVANQFLRDAELRAMAYTDEPPTDDEVREREVYVVDFSFKREVCERIARSAKLTIIDHHKSAKEELAGLAYAQFDMHRSGAGLVWDYFSNEPRPWLVDYVEDRDLWCFELWKSKEVNAAVACTPMTLEAWDRLSKNGRESAAVVGAGALLFEQMCAHKAAETASIVRFEGYDVPFVNVPHTLSSVTAGLLAENAPFAVAWFQQSDGMFRYSLRSRGEGGVEKGGVDVSEIAKKWGGGGHRNASGFTSELLLTEPARMAAKECAWVCEERVERRKK